MWLSSSSLATSAIGSMQRHKAPAVPSMDMKHEEVGALHLHAGHRVVLHPVFVAHASAPNLRRIGFKRVDVYHPPGKMWPEKATRRSASLRGSDRAVQPEGWITHEPIALFGLLWNTQVEVHMPLRDRERDAGIELLVGRTVTRHVHDTNKLVSRARSINFRVEQPARLVRV